MKEKDMSGYVAKTHHTVEEIEANLWKNNIKQGPRKFIDHLDVSQEDFSKNKSKGINGAEVTPSSFNVLRDSLA